MAKLIPTLIGDFRLSIHEEVFSFGRSWEDGEEVIGTAFQLVAEGTHGERYYHDRTFRVTHSCSQSHDFPEDGICEEQAAQEFHRESEAQAAAEKLLARVVEAQNAQTWAGPVNNPHWGEGQPCYGSEAYEAGGWEALNAEQEANEEGFTYQYGRGCAEPIPGFVPRR